MKTLGRFLTLFSVLALAIVACSINVDFGTPQRLSPDLLPTMVAQTFQAMTAAVTATPTNVPTASASPTPTNVPPPATLSVSTATDCYAGPSRNYGYVFTIRPGVIVDVVGKDTSDNYWVIAVPGYPGTVCWLSGQYAQVTGDINTVPLPATPLPSIYTLSEPRNLRVSCSSENLSDDDDEDEWWHDAARWTVTFRWTNTEPDQTGVRVFRNGRLIDTLGAHAGSITDTFIHHHHGEVTYGVQAYSRTAVSSIVTIDVRHCD